MAEKIDCDSKKLRLNAVGRGGNVLSFHTFAEFHMGRRTGPALCGFEGRKQRGSYGGGYWIPGKMLPSMAQRNR